MKKIILFAAVIAAFAVSCSSPFCKEMSSVDSVYVDSVIVDSTAIVPVSDTIS